MLETARQTNEKKHPNSFKSTWQSTKESSNFWKLAPWRELGRGNACLWAGAPVYRRRSLASSL